MRILLGLLFVLSCGSDKHIQCLIDRKYTNLSRVGVVAMPDDLDANGGNYLFVATDPDGIRNNFIVRSYNIGKSHLDDKASMKNAFALHSIITGQYTYAVIALLAKKEKSHLDDWSCDIYKLELQKNE